MTFKLFSQYTFVAVLTSTTLISEAKSKSSRHSTAKEEATAESILPAQPVFSEAELDKQRAKSLRDDLVGLKADKSKTPLYQDGKTNWWRDMEVMQGEQRKIYMEAFKENSDKYSGEEKTAIEKRIADQEKIHSEWKEKTNLRLEKLRGDKNMSAEDMEPLLRDIKKQMYLEQTNLSRAYSHIVGTSDKEGGFTSRSAPGSEIAPQMKKQGSDALKLDDKFRDSQLMVEAQLNSLYRRNADALNKFDDVLDSPDVKDYAKDMGMESKFSPDGGKSMEDVKVFR